MWISSLVSRLFRGNQNVIRDAMADNHTSLSDSNIIDVESEVLYFNEFVELKEFVEASDEHGFISLQWKDLGAIVLQLCVEQSSVILQFNSRDHDWRISNIVDANIRLVVKKRSVTLTLGSCPDQERMFSIVFQSDAETLIFVNRFSISQDPTLTYHVLRERNQISDNILISVDSIDTTNLETTNENILENERNSRDSNPSQDHENIITSIETITEESQIVFIPEQSQSNNEANASDPLIEDVAVVVDDLDSSEQGYVSLLVSPLHIREDNAEIQEDMNLSAVLSESPVENDRADTVTSIESITPEQSQSNNEANTSDPLIEDVAVVVIGSDSSEQGYVSLLASHLHIREDNAEIQEDMNLSALLSESPVKNNAVVAVSTLLSSLHLDDEQLFRYQEGTNVNTSNDDDFQEIQNESTFVLASAIPVVEATNVSILATSQPFTDQEVVITPPAFSIGTSNSNSSTRARQRNRVSVRTPSQPNLSNPPSESNLRFSFVTTIESSNTIANIFPSYDNPFAFTPQPMSLFPNSPTSLSINSSSITSSSNTRDVPDSPTFNVQPSNGKAVLENITLSPETRLFNIGTSDSTRSKRNKSHHSTITSSRRSSKSSSRNMAQSTSSITSSPEVPANPPSPAFPFATSTFSVNQPQTPPSLFASSISSPSSICSRCGRNSHIVSQCYASSHANGSPLINNNVSSGNRNCFRCGRNTHWVSACYARTHISGYRL